MTATSHTAKAPERKGGGFHSELHFWNVEEILRRTSSTALDADLSCWTNARWMPFCIELRQFTADCAAHPKPFIHCAPKFPPPFASAREFSFPRRFWIPDHMIKTTTSKTWKYPTGNWRPIMNRKHFNQDHHRIELMMFLTGASVKVTSTSLSLEMQLCRCIVWIELKSCHQLVRKRKLAERKLTPDQSNMNTKR